MKENQEMKFTEGAKGRGFVAALALGITVSILTVRAASEDTPPASLSGRHQIINASTVEGQDTIDDTMTSAAGNLVPGPVPPFPLKSCCIYDPSGIGVCTNRVDPDQCRANGGSPKASCISGCPFQDRPDRIAPAGTAENFTDTTDDAQDSEPVQDAPTPVSTGSAWTLLVATLFLAGL